MSRSENRRSMLQILYAAALLVSGLLTVGLGLRTLVDRDGMMASFGVELSAAEGLDLLIAVLGAVILSLGLVVLLAAWWVWCGTAAGRTLGLLSAATLLLVAVAAWTQAGSMQVLLLDGVRGVVLLVLGLMWRPQGS